MFKPKPQKMKIKKATNGSGKAKLGVGGKPLSDKDTPKAIDAVAGMRQGNAIRKLIQEFDADNDSIMEIMDLPDDKAVQRTRRAIRREENAA